MVAVRAKRDRDRFGVLGRPVPGPMAVGHHLNGEAKAFMLGTFGWLPLRFVAPVYLALSNSLVKQSTRESPDIPSVELGQR